MARRHYLLTLSEGVGGGTAYTGPQIVIVGYGQSNWLRMLTETSSPDAAAADTYWLDPATGLWTSSVPVGNGIRKLLNAVRSGTGKTVGIVSAGQSGVNIAALMEGDASGNFATLATRIAASGCRYAEELYIVWRHGEGDGNTASPNAATYTGSLDTLHQSIVDEVGKTKAQMPMITSGLATVTEVSFTNPDSSWAEIQKALVTAHDTYPNIHYSHSNYDAALLDGVHETAASFAQSGERSARKLLAVRGTVATAPNWSIVSATRVDATHTDITVAHSMGTDFTPTSGITGFTISNDNWATSATISAAARQDATTIRLTHDDLGTANDRQIRYQYGKTPTVSGAVIDNSSLAVPLNHSGGQSITAAGAGANPQFTHKTAASSTGSGITQTWSGLDLSGLGSVDTEVLVLLTNQAAVSVSAITITPNGGSAISGTLVVQGSTNVHGSIWRFPVPSASTGGLSNAAASVTYNTSPFNQSRAEFGVTHTSRLSSTTPVDTDTAQATNTALTLDISTSTGGFYIAAAISANVSTNTCAWTGDEPPVELSGEASVGGARHSHASANGTTAHTNDNTITATFTNSAAMRIVAASFR